MARNKHPEETVAKILDVSMRLFTEQGYEHTTIQDIVDALGMSKGAIYHHFKSKEDILDRINDRYYENLEWFSDPAKLPGRRDPPPRDRGGAHAPDQRVDGYVPRQPGGIRRQVALLRGISGPLRPARAGRGPPGRRAELL